MVKPSKNIHPLLDSIQPIPSDPSQGYFGSESMTWKLYREPSIVLGSMHALLLQLAHPAVAKGVSMFSHYQKDVAGRAHRTFLSMVRIWFGDIKTANHSARRLYHIHSMIRGQLVWETEDEIIINPFCAADPDLLYWVLATLVDTTLVLFEKTVRPLSEWERNQFFEESKITAQLMGIPLEEYPSTLTDFYKRYHNIINNGTLRLQPEGKAIVDTIFNTPYPVRKFNEIMAAGLLPDHLNKLFGLKASKTIFNTIITLAKVHNRLVPNDLRYAPHYHQAMYRLALSHRRSPRIIERIHHWVSNHINWHFFSNKLNLGK